MSSPTSMSSTIDPTWWVFVLRPVLKANDTVFDGYLLFFIFVAVVTTSLLTWALFPGGVAWKNGLTRLGDVPIPGPRGLPIFGSLFTLTQNLPHRALAAMARDFKARDLMAFSIGNTPAVVSSDPVIAREILCHGSFADRPLKQSARELMFGRAIGFAPSGSYWRLLRRVAATHLFAPRRIADHESSRQADCDVMLGCIAREQETKGFVSLRRHLQGAALNNIMGSVFGKRYDVSMEDDEELLELKYLVREGFDLLGAFNWSDHLPWLSFFFDHNHVSRRCATLVPRVRRFVKAIIEQHKEKTDRLDFVDVLLSLEGDDKLGENDTIAVLWEMIFRGTDTTALLTEWAMAELVLNRNIQTKLRHELDQVTGSITDADVARLPYLQAVIKETLRIHPPGPLLSWARMSTSDVHLSNGMVVPANTTAMINMWSISNDRLVWAEPDKFKPERFMVNEGGVNIGVKGSDTRLAPFGAGRRICPGKNLGLVTVGLWVARLVKEFEWKEVDGSEVDLTEVLKLSCEMKSPLVAVAVKL